jgi:hypothetical protein
MFGVTPMPEGHLLYLRPEDTPCLWDKIKVTEQVSSNRKVFEIFEMYQFQILA